METLVHDYRFNGPITPPTSAGTIPWVKNDVSSAGTPTLVGAGGFMKGALDSQNEAQNLCLYFGDDLPFDIDDILRADFWMKIGSQGMGAACTLSFGLAAARNDTPESIAAHALFKLVGDTSVKVSTDDGVNDVSDQATGLTLSTTLKRFSMDFRGGVKTVSPGPSRGGKSNVLFSVSDDRGVRQRVCPSINFDMGNYAAGLQPFVQLQKTAAATVAEFHLARVRIETVLRA